MNSNLKILVNLYFEIRLHYLSVLIISIVVTLDLPQILY